MDAVTVDWNGDKPTNKWGEDQLNVTYCYGSVPCYSSFSARPICGGDTTPQPPGSIVPRHDPVWCASANKQLLIDNGALFDKIFSK